MLCTKHAPEKLIALLLKGKMIFGTHPSVLVGCRTVLHYDGVLGDDGLVWNNHQNYHLIRHMKVVSYNNFLWNVPEKLLLGTDTTTPLSTPTSTANTSPFSGVGGATGCGYSGNAPSGENVRKSNWQVIEHFGSKDKGSLSSSLIAVSVTWSDNYFFLTFWHFFN